MSVIEPKHAFDLDRTVRDYFMRLSDYKAPFVQEKLVLDGIFPMEKYDEAFTELKKYVGLAALHRKPLAMTSRTIDDVWHQFILFTREYHDFSQQFYGGYFHHAPNLPSKRENPALLDNFLQLYTKTYGAIPEIWELCEHSKAKVAA
jgi:hypothetical protein